MLAAVSLTLLHSAASAFWPHVATCRATRRAPLRLALAVAEADLLTEVRRQLGESRDRVTRAVETLDLRRHRGIVPELELQSSSPGFWDDTSTAEAVLRRLGESKQVLQQADAWQRTIDDAEAVVELVPEMADEPDAVAELLADATASLATLATELARWELRALMSGPYDRCGAVLSLVAGSGGVDAMDWTEMLLRMYERWASAAGYRVVRRSMHACTRACTHGHGHGGGLTILYVRMHGRCSRSARTARRCVHA